MSGELTPPTLFFLTLVHGMRDSSSLTRDRICAPLQGLPPEKSPGWVTPRPSCCQGRGAGRLKDAVGAWEHLVCTAKQVTPASEPPDSYL